MASGFAGYRSARHRPVRPGVDLRELGRSALDGTHQLVKLGVRHPAPDARQPRDPFHSELLAAFVTHAPHQCKRISKSRGI